MRHLKTYEAPEEYRPEYDYYVGDCVELWARNKVGAHRKGEVVEITTHNAYVGVLVKSYITGKLITMNLSPENIKRKLTPEEAEEYKIGIETNKYNL